MFRGSFGRLITTKSGFRTHDSQIEVEPRFSDVIGEIPDPPYNIPMDFGDLVLRAPETDFARR